jgi:hypothetical protein
MIACATYICMTSLPLVLTLEPLLPTRCASGHRKEFRFGYQLRLPGGPLVETDDPLLAVFGAEAVTLEVEGGNEEAIQSATFDPGARLHPVFDSLDDDGDPVVAIWDAAELHCAGILPFQVAGRVAAALDHGLDIQLFSLEESRTALDDRRVGLRVLVSSTSMVRIKHPKHARAIRPARRVRQRVVLLADGRGRIRWWDPSGASGPAEITQMPVSSHLQAELDRLGREFETLCQRAQESQGGLSRMVLDGDRAAFTERALELWKRVRAELTRDYAVGFVGPGMERPIWSPSEMSYDGDDVEIPF